MAGSLGNRYLNAGTYRGGLVAGILAIGVVLVWGAQQTDNVDSPYRVRPARVSDESTEGAVVLRPSRIPAAAIGSYELRVTLGGQGIARDGAILIEFPKAWFVNPFPIAKRLQTSDPAKPHFLSVSVSRGTSRLEVSIGNVGFTGKVERFNQTISAIVTREALQAGDTITITLSNTTGPYLAGSDEVNVAIDADGSKRFKTIRERAHYEVVGGSGGLRRARGLSSPQRESPANRPRQETTRGWRRHMRRWSGYRRHARVGDAARIPHVVGIPKRRILQVPVVETRLEEPLERVRNFATVVIECASGDGGKTSEAGVWHRDEWRQDTRAMG